MTLKHFKIRFANVLRPRFEYAKFDLTMENRNK